MLGLLWGLAHDEDGGRGGDGVDDPDDRLLRDACLAMHAGEGEDCRSDDRESERPEVAHAAMEVVARQERHCRAQRGDLREGEVDEDDPALDDVDAEVCVNAGENESRQERRDEKHHNVHYFSAFVSSLMS